MLKFLLFLFLLFFTSSISLGEEVETPKKDVLPPIESAGFFSDLKDYTWAPWVWGFIDELHFIEERTAEVHAHRGGNRFLLRTPYGGFLVGYERTEGTAALFPRRNNIFGGRLHKQPFESGSQDKREYGYFIDTRRLRKWLEGVKEAEGLLKEAPIDVQGHIVFIDSDAAVGDKQFVNFASESFESIESDLRAFVNSGRWYGLGLDFLFIRHNPKTFGRFALFEQNRVRLAFDQNEVVDRDLFRGRITVPALREFHISGYYDENHDTHRFENTNVTSVTIPAIGTLPVALIPNRSVHPTRRKFGPEFTYFFGEDLYRSTTFGFYAYTGENAGSLAEYDLKRAFRVDSAGQFGSLDLHNSFGLRIGYQEFYKRASEDEVKWEKWGLNFEAAFLDSDDVSGPFSGRIFFIPPGSPPTQGSPATAIRQFDEDLKEFFFKGNFFYRFDPKGEKPHPLAGMLRADFSFWNIEREGKQTQKIILPLATLTDVVRSFRDDRRILQLSTSYELDRPRHHFGGLYSVGLDFNWDVETSDKVGGINVGFFY